MKKCFMLLVVCATMGTCFAQIHDKADFREQIVAATDSLSEEQKEVLFSLFEDMMISRVDSVKNEGRFMQALEITDSMLAKAKTMMRRNPSPRMYITKMIILMQLEEWRDLIKTTEECLSIHRETANDRITAQVYSMQGNAHRNLDEYQEAIRSYENGAYYFNNIANNEGNGNMLCNMAYCYMKLTKHSTAFSLYKKGIDKYLEYFGTTRSALLKKDLVVNDSYEQTVLSVFSYHLLDLALFEQKYGSSLKFEEYLLMSAHCGNTNVKSAYQRVDGDKQWDW